MILQGGTTGNIAEVTSNKAGLVSLQQRGNAYSVSAITGLMPVTIAANGLLFAMRLDPSAGNLKAFIERVRISFTCIAAFTTPITTGRRLQLIRASGANAASGTAIATVAKKRFGSVDSEFETAMGGDIRISSTGQLTTTGITFEANEFASLPLSHVGNAGNFIESIFEFNATESAPIVIDPGQLLCIRNPQAMDAGGTWQMSVRIDWYEENVVTL